MIASADSREFIHIFQYSCLILRVFDPSVSVDRSPLKRGNIIEFCLQNASYQCKQTSHEKASTYISFCFPISQSTISWACHLNIKVGISNKIVGEDTHHTFIIAVYSDGFFLNSNRGKKYLLIQFQADRGTNFQYFFLKG